MRSIVMKAVFLCLSLTSLPAVGESWRAVFVTEDGTRIDFLSNKRTFISRKDASSAYRFEFTVPDDGNRATIRLLPVGANTGPSEDYEAVIIIRGPDMVVLLMLHDGTRRGDKFESYTLYPKLGVGFLATTSSFLGNPIMKELAAIKPEIPAGSGMVFPLRRIDQ
jgi:hypothetical protein